MAKTYTAAELAGMTDREVSAITAQVVMGWRLKRCGRYESDYRWYTSHGVWTWNYFIAWHPAHDWRCTGEVIERMMRRWFALELSEGNPHITMASWDCEFPRIRIVFWNTNPCRAICEAAVLATQAWRAVRKAKR